MLNLIILPCTHLCFMSNDLSCTKFCVGVGCGFAPECNLFTYVGQGLNRN